MKSFVYYCSLAISLMVIIHLICNQLQVDSDFKYYFTGTAIGYIICKFLHCKQIEACNKLISEIKEIVQKLK